LLVYGRNLYFIFRESQAQRGGQAPSQGRISPRPQR
jgi:hypothetical protein